MREKLILKELCRYNIGTFADIVYRNALLYPDDEAFVCVSQRITFSQYNARVNSLIHALCSLGIKKGDVLGILAWNCIEYLDIFGAAMKGGFIASPFNPRLHMEELEYLINYSEAKALFVGPELSETVNNLKSRLPNVKLYIALKGSVPGTVSQRELLATHPPVEPDESVLQDDPFLIFYTSGTTGVPRGALYTHRRKLENTKTKALEMGVKADDKHLLVLPLFHIGGDSHVWPFFYVAGCNVVI